MRLVILQLTVLLTLIMQADGRTAALAQNPCDFPAGWTRLGFPEPPGPPSDDVLLSHQPLYSRYGIQFLSQRWDDFGVLYAGGPNGVYRSRDCSRSWERLSYPPGLEVASQRWDELVRDGEQPVPIHNFAPVAVSPSGRLFVQRTASNFWVSDDDGQTWELSGLPGKGDHLAFGPGGTAWLFGYHSVRDSSDFPLMARSTDDGHTWGVRRVDVYPNWSQMPRVFAVDPRNETVLVIGRQDGRVTRSDDWGQTEIEFARFAGPIAAVDLSEDSPWMWVAAGDGSLRVSSDEGQSWRIVGGTPGAVQRNGVHVLRGSQGHAVFVLTMHGELWAYREPDAAPAQLP